MLFLAQFKRPETFDSRHMPLFCTVWLKGFTRIHVSPGRVNTLTPRRAARLRSCTSVEDMQATNLAVYWVLGWVLVASCA